MQMLNLFVRSVVVFCVLVSRRGLTLGMAVHQNMPTMMNFSIYGGGWRLPRRQNPPPGVDLGEQGVVALSRRERMLEEGVSILDSRESLVFTTARESIGVVELANIQWLHVPKAGTSFIGTIWGYACGRGDLPLDLNVDPKAAPDCLACYDFALMDRYPKDLFCANGVLHTDFQTQHMPMTEVMMDQGVNAVGLFRKPSQRLISAYIDGYHTQGFSDDTYLALRKQCDGKTVGCFARFPGVAGCATRMLTGKRCADDPAKYPEGIPSHIERVPDAIEALKKMTFVGITEEWDESVCLFHLMFGGVLYSDEFRDMHKGPRDQSNSWDEADLDGFVDEADEAIYDAAMVRFRDLRRQYAGGDSACARIPGATSVVEQDQEEYLMRVSSHSMLNVTGSFQLPEAHQVSTEYYDLRMDCRTAGVQCGPLQNQRSCGVCPAMRLRALPDWQGMTNSEIATHRPECSPVGSCLVNGLQMDDLFSWSYTIP